MESPHLIFLKNVSQGTAASSTEIRDALHRLDHMLADLAADLQTAYAGPYVGLRHSPEQHLLAVAEHRWSLEKIGWGIAICSLHSTYGMRAEWTLANVSRERLPIIVAALPAFFSGYASATSKSAARERPSALRLKSLAELFTH